MEPENHLKMKRNIIFHPPPWLVVPSFNSSGEFPNKIRPFHFFSEEPTKGLRSRGDQESPIFSWDSNHKTCGSSVRFGHAGPHTSRMEKKIEGKSTPKISWKKLGCFFVAHEFSLDGLDLLLKLFLRFFHNPRSPRTVVVVDSRGDSWCLVVETSTCQGWRWGIPDGWLLGFPNRRFE